MESKANSIFMFSLYLAIVLSILKKNMSYMVIVIAGALISVGYIGGDKNHF